MLALILYFSGTGNTKYVAREFEKELLKRSIGVELHSIEDAADLRNVPYDLLLIGFPKYYECPVVAFQKYIKQNLPKRVKEIPVLAFCTQAGPLPTDFSSLKRLLKRKNYRLTVSKSFPFANNMMIFSSFKLTEASELAGNIQKIREQTGPLLDLFLEGQPSIEDIPSWQKPLLHLVASGCTKGMPVFAMRFSASTDCIHCGLCAKQCPANNIQMVDGKPVFHKHCLFCMRCINACPTNAILYNHKKCPQYKCEQLK